MDEFDRSWLAVVARLALALAGLAAVGASLWRLAPAGPSSASVGAVAVWLGRAPSGTQVAWLAMLGAWGCLLRLTYALLTAATAALARGAPAPSRGVARRVAARVLGVPAVAVVMTAAAIAPPAYAYDTDPGVGPFERPVPAVATASPPSRVATTAVPLPPRPERAGRRPHEGPVVVRRGDTLWGIAARALRAAGARARPTLVARAWPRWYAANRDRIGPDPGVIRPGQRLVPPRDGIGGVR